MINSKLFKLINVYYLLSVRHKILVIIVLFLAVFSGIMELTSVLLVSPFLIALLNPVNESSVNNAGISVMGKFEVNMQSDTLVFLFGIVVILTSVSRLLTLWFSGRVSSIIGTNLAVKALNNILYQNLEYHIRKASTSLIATINVQTVRTVLTIFGFFQSCTSFVISILLLSVLLLFNFWGAIVFASIIVTSYSLIGFFTKQRLALNSSLIADLSKSQQRIVREALGSVRDILIDSMQERFTSNFYKVDRKLKLLQVNNQYLSFYPRFVLEALGLVALGAIGFYYKSNDLLDSNSLISFLSVFALASQRLLPAVQTIYSGWATLSGYFSDFEDIVELATLPSSRTNPPKLIRASQLPNNNITFKNISYRYPGTTSLVFDNISIDIPCGSVIGIKGSTGSGKSTFADLLMGLLKPTSGEILFGDTVVNPPSSSEIEYMWKAGITHVPQKIFLCDDTIFFNISFSDDKSVDILNRVIEAARHAECTDFIEKLPNTYFSMVGEDGISFSGGQRQRLALARAFYKINKNIILLDEATSALDPDTESKVIHSVLNRNDNCTIIMIAHRLNTLENCDYILELPQGMLIKNKK